MSQPDIYDRKMTDVLTPELAKAVIECGIVELRELTGSSAVERVPQRQE